MKKLVFLGLVLASSFAHADGYLPEMTCADARQMVCDEGAVILWQSDDIYDRYVAHQGYCDRDQTTQPAWVMTSDSNSCFVGYTCRRIDW